MNNPLKELDKFYKDFEKEKVKKAMGEWEYKTKALARVMIENPENFDELLNFYDFLKFWKDCIQKRYIEMQEKFFQREFIKISKMFKDKKEWKNKIKELRKRMKGVKNYIKDN